MKKSIGWGVMLMVSAAPASAAVFINKVFINPPGSLDATQEFVELMGPPGMKLDGYAVAVINGTLKKFYPFGTIPPVPSVHPEIDEFFSLDGLQLGANGILVLGGGSQSNYVTLLADSAFRTWTGEYPVGLWNGFLDVPGKLDNDGSNTIMLIRNRPGATSGGGPTFNPPADLRWGKDIPVDTEIIEPVSFSVCTGGANPGDPCYSASDCLGGTCAVGNVVQYGDGSLDKGVADSGNPAETQDLKGESTTGDVSDDLEVVDEVSYEDGHGHEYDTDDRHVDNGSTSTKLPRRRVHALNDPQGFNPDCLVRVDYRTKGNGWTPVAGGTGEASGGKNWQDTATEQWIRGESILGSGGQGPSPQMFFDVTANADPNALQPYMVNVPSWLADGSAPDFNFTTAFQYQIMAGRVNPLAITFNPGDVNRDGVCDAQDIAKMASVFGNDNLVFSNSFAESPETNSGDPSLQTRPWDVDLTGNNGIEASDFQWVLNFQGNTTGRIVGVRYDSTTPTPAAQGVYLNPNTNVVCAVTTITNSLSGRPLSSLRVGDQVQITIRARVTGGVNTLASQQNGIMQYAMDVAINTGAVLRVIEEGSLSPFTSTRAIQSMLGLNGDEGIGTLNGYTATFTQGLSSTISLNRVTVQAVGIGTATVNVTPAQDPRFLESTPWGLKVGHTDHQGDPASATYPSGIVMNVTGTVRPDFNADGHVTQSDLVHFVACRTRSGVAQVAANCQDARLDGDSDVDQDDFAIFQRCYSGPTGTPSQDCDNL